MRHRSGGFIWEDRGRMHRTIYCGGNKVEERALGCLEAVVVAVCI